MELVKALGLIKGMHHKFTADELIMSAFDLEKMEEALLGFVIIVGTKLMIIQIIAQIVGNSIKCQIKALIV